jgi:hypothetical protein
MRQQLHDVSIGTDGQGFLVFVPLVVVAVVPTTMTAVIAAVVTAAAAVARVIVTPARIIGRSGRGDVEFDREIRGAARNLRLDRLRAFRVP